MYRRSKTRKSQRNSLKREQILTWPVGRRTIETRMIGHWKKKNESKWQRMLWNFSAMRMETKVYTVSTLYFHFYHTGRFNYMSTRWSLGCLDLPTFTHSQAQTHAQAISFKYSHSIKYAHIHAHKDSVIHTYSPSALNEQVHLSPNL